MQRIGEFVREGDALVWRRATSGCTAVFGWATAVFNGLFAAGGVAAFVNSGQPLGAVFVGVGGLGFLFGLALATARSEVRVNRHEAVIRRSVIVPMGESRVAVSGCAAVAAVRNLVAVPQAPRSVTPRRYAPTLSVGLVSPQGFVALATEHEDAQSEASVVAAVQALQSVTALPAQDLRQSSQVLMAAVMERRWKAAGVGLLIAGVLVVLAAVFAFAMTAMNDSPHQGGGTGVTAPRRHRGR